MTPPADELKASSIDVAPTYRHETGYRPEHEPDRDTADVSRLVAMLGEALAEQSAELNRLGERLESVLTSEAVDAALKAALPEPTCELAGRLHSLLDAAVRNRQHIEDIRLRIRL